MSLEWDLHRPVDFHSDPTSHGLGSVGLFSRDDATRRALEVEVEDVGTDGPQGARSGWPRGKDDQQALTCGLASRGHSESARAEDVSSPGLSMSLNPPSSGSGRPSGQPKPPVVVPGSGNNIIVNPCQVRPRPGTKSQPIVQQCPEREPSPRVHQECGQGVWGDTCGLPSREDHRRALP